jgi:hypothetical protein
VSVRSKDEGNGNNGNGNGTSSKHNRQGLQASRKRAQDKTKQDMMTMGIGRGGETRSAGRVSGSLHHIDKRQVKSEE